MYGYGKTALVTGASTGIGKELAVVFAENGYDVVLVARTKTKLDKLAKQLSDEFGSNTTVIAKDLTKVKAPGDLFAETQAAGLHIDVLVNNAGFGSFKPFAETDRARVSDMVRLNVGALTELSHLYSQPMIEKGEGRILNVASVAAFSPTPGAAVYGATKAFVLSLTEALSEELRPHGVNVTALCPGLTETEFSKNATGKTPEEEAVPAFLKLSAREVAEEGFEALHNGEVIKVNGWAYQLGVEWMKYTPRFLNRAMGGVFSKQLENGF